MSSASVPASIERTPVRGGRWGSTARAVAAQCVLPAALLGLLELAAATGLLDARFVPTPRVVAVGLIEIFATGEVWPHAARTLRRILEGYAIAATAGITLGLALGAMRSLRSYVLPVVELLRPIPGVTLLPLTILWFGMGDRSQVPVIAFAAFFATFVNTMHGVKEIPPILVRAARVMELRGVRLFWKVMLPASAPHIFTGLRLSVVYALTSCIGTEIIAGTDGLGFLILDYERSFVTPKMFGVMILVAVLGFALNSAVLAVQRRVLRYRI